MFASSFYDRLDPSYRDELLKLENQIEAIKEKKTEESNKEILKLLDNFSCQFLMPKKLWNQKIKIVEDFDERYYVAHACIYHLSYLTISERESLGLTYLHDKKLCYDEERAFSRWCWPYEPISVEASCFPHKDLEKKWKEYEECADAFIPREINRRFEKSKLLYKNIKSIDPYNTEEWFQAVSEAEDIEFVEQNIEYQISQDLTNKTLWKLYIAYLQENDQEKLLETYSKYCRFFNDDFEMFKEYKKTAEKFGPSKVPWKNTFEFEICDQNVLYDFKTPIFTPAANTVLKCSCHFDGINALPQTFLFPKTYMKYIIKNAKAQILFNLFKCCKWFFVRYPIPVCYKFQASKWNAEVIRQQSIFIRDLSHLKIDNKLFVSYGFSFRNKDAVALSKFIPKIYLCTAKQVDIHDQNMTMNELKFLIGHGNVISLHLFIKDQDGHQFAFEDILQLVPKIQKFDVTNTKCPVNISQYLFDFPFQNKLEKFRFGDVKILPEPYGFAEFILKNASLLYSSKFYIYGNMAGKGWDDSKDLQHLRDVVTKSINEQWKGLQRPEIAFC